MHPTTHARWPRLCAGLILAAGLAGAAANGQQPAGQPPPQPAAKDLTIGDVKVDAKTGALVVHAGGLVRFKPALAKDDIVTDILISDESVIQVRLDSTTPGALLITGRIPGLTRLTLVLKDKPKREYEVIVQFDFDLLRNLIKRTVPTANVEVTPGINNIVILSGYVTSPQDADIITRLAISQVGNTNNVINAMQVGGVQQVQIDVVVASVDRNEVRNRGFDFSAAGKTVQFSSVLSGLLTPAASSSATTSATFSPNANLQLGLVPSHFFAALQALRTEGLAKFLTEPRVVTQTGRPATFRSGGQQAILGPSSGINGPGVILQPFGTELEVLPIVYGNGKIWLEINPRITAVNQGLGITTVFGTTPGFTEQSARCAVMLESGQTFAIGGLIQNSVSAASSRVPVLGDLPFVGTLFSSVSYTEREDELVILVTPRLVSPMDCNQVPRRLPGRETRTPDDYELFLEGILEAPRGQRKVWNGRCYNAAYKCDPTVATFPCVGNLCYGPSVGGGMGAGCGANGCVAPATHMMPGRAAGFPVPSVQPNPVSAATMPQNPLPVVIVPQAPPEPMTQPAPATLPATVPQAMPETVNVIPPAPLAPLAPAAPTGQDDPLDAQPK